jgi:hypothetical protein
MSPEAPHPSREDLFAYRDGELTAERRVLIEAHVVTCRFCKDVIDQVSAIEADLKSRPDAVGDAYFERLTEKVLRRVKAEAPVPRAERRRAEAEIPVGEEDARPRLRLFWPAVISTATAAAAILVIVMLVAKEGEFWKPTARPKVATVEESAPDAGARRQAAESPPAGAPATPSDAKREQDAQARADQKNAGEKAGGEAKTQSRDEFFKETTAGTTQEQAKLEAEAKKSDVDLARGKDRAEGEVMAQRAAPAPAASAPEANEGARARAIGSVAPSPQNMADAQASPQFESLRSRYGLPPDWGPGVSDEMILKAEGPLRNLYRTGGATTPLDSARVRLYLAEAARTRVGSAPDSAAIGEIAHHYRRVIRLAGPDSPTGKIAAERLADFLREVGLTP